MTLYGDVGLRKKGATLMRNMTPFRRSRASQSGRYSDFTISHLRHSEPVQCGTRQSVDLVVPPRKRPGMPVIRRSSLIWICSLSLWCSITGCEQTNSDANNTTLTTESSAVTSSSSEELCAAGTKAFEEPQSAPSVRGQIVTAGQPAGVARLNFRLVMLTRASR